MHFDILCSLVIYTLATVAFYLLGAGILNRSGLVPAQRDMIQVLSRIYTQSLGEWALWLFYVGAVITLYGTIFASTAAHSRLFADAVRVGGLYARDDSAARRRWRTRFLIALSLIPPVLYWFIESPVQMVVIGGIAQASMLPLIGIAAIYLRHKHVPEGHPADGGDDRDVVDRDGGDGGVRSLLRRRAVALSSVGFKLKPQDRPRESRSEPSSTSYKRRPRAAGFRLQPEGCVRRRYFFLSST